MTRKPKLRRQQWNPKRLLLATQWQQLKDWGLSFDTPPSRELLHESIAIPRDKVDSSVKKMLSRKDVNWVLVEVERWCAHNWHLKPTRIKNGDPEQ